MNLNISSTDKLFNPINPILLYLFMAITTLHMKIPFLISIHIETLTLVAVIINTLFYILYKDELKFNFEHPIIIPFLIGQIFIISPLITSLFNHQMLNVLKDDEYKDLFKIIIFSPCLFFFLQKEEFKNKILNFIILSYLIFGLYFLYRFLILHEVRDFDLRPLLKIRNGDANFICTFFAMMFPLPLMQAWHYKNKNKPLLSALFSLTSLFFFICAFLTESRMGIIAIVIGLFYLASRPLITPTSKMALSIVFIVTVFVVFLSGDSLLQRYADIQDKSNADRYLTWKNGLILFQENPIIGSGIHTAPASFYKNTQYPPFQSEFRQLDVHNTFIKVAAELGILGLISFLILYFRPWIKSCRLQSEKRTFLICSMGILTISIMTIGIIYKELFILHLFIIWALAENKLVKNN